MVWELLSLRDRNIFLKIPQKNPQNWRITKTHAIHGFNSSLDQVEEKIRKFKDKSVEFIPSEMQNKCFGNVQRAWGFGDTIRRPKRRSWKRIERRKGQNLKRNPVADKFIKQGINRCPNPGFKEY